MDYNGNINSIIKYFKYDYTPKCGDIFKPGAMYFDYSNNKLYIGNFGFPYEIDEFDSFLIKTKTYKKSLSNKYREAKWYIDKYGNSTCIGNVLISGIVNDSNYIYTSFGGGYVHSHDNTQLYKPLRSKVQISRSPKLGGNSCELTVNELGGLKGFVKILGIDKKKIYLFVYDSSNLLDHFCTITNKQYGYKKAFIVIENSFTK